MRNLAARRAKLGRCRSLNSAEGRLTEHISLSTERSMPQDYTSIDSDSLAEDRTYAAASLFTTIGISFPTGTRARSSEAMQITKHTTLISRRFR